MKNLSSYRNNFSIIFQLKENTSVQIYINLVSFQFHQTKENKNSIKNNYANHKRIYSKHQTIQPTLTYENLKSRPTSETTTPSKTLTSSVLQNKKNPSSTAQEAQPKQGEPWGRSPGFNRLLLRPHPS